jgi:hypothetical protein
VSVFAAPFLFLRDPHGGVEDLASMKAAGFRAVFCNIGDHPASEWETIIRPRAAQQGMACGPWLRTAGSDGGFDRSRLDRLIDQADRWQSPLIVNSESELNGSGDDLTPIIAAAIGDRDGAVSMEPIPFANVHWYPLADVPVLPQVFKPGGYSDPIPVRDLWHAYGVKCVYPTFASYGGSTPKDYPLQAPYSIYTGDDCGGNYQAWKPTSTGYVGCVQTPVPPKPPDGNGDDMQMIGSQDGATAACNRLRDLDPGGTLLVKDQKGNWPSLSTLPADLSKWKAYDKLERTLSILAEDHDVDAALRSSSVGI